MSCSESLLVTVSCSWLLYPNPCPLADLSIAHINARSLHAFDTDLKSNGTHLDEIESALFLEYRCDIICTRETWLISNIFCEVIDINNSTVYSKDNSGYGGVAIYAADYLLSQSRVEIEIQRIDYLGALQFT